MGRLLLGHRLRGDGGHHRALRPVVRLYGVRVGVVLLQLADDAALLFRGAAEIPGRLRPALGPRLRQPRGGALRGGHVCAHRVGMAPLRLPDAPAGAICRVFAPAGFARGDKRAPKALEKQTIGIYSFIL